MTLFQCFLFQNDFKLPKEEGKETYFNSIGYLNDETILLSYYFQEPLNENESKELITESSYENPKYKYATVDKEGNLKEIDLDFSVYNDDEESTDGSYSNFKSSLSGDVFFSTGSNNEKIVQFDGKTFEEKHVYEGEEWINDFLNMILQGERRNVI